VRAFCQRTNWQGKVGVKNNSMWNAESVPTNSSGKVRRHLSHLGYAVRSSEHVRHTTVAQHYQSDRKLKKF